MFFPVPVDSGQPGLSRASVLCHRPMADLEFLEVAKVREDSRGRDQIVGPIQQPIPREPPFIDRVSAPAAPAAAARHVAHLRSVFMAQAKLPRWRPPHDALRRRLAVARRKIFVCAVLFRVCAAECATILVQRVSPITFLPVGRNIDAPSRSARMWSLDSVIFSVTIPSGCVLL